MAYNEKLAERIRQRLGKRNGQAEKKMFGGIGFLLQGNMCCGVHGEDMIVRPDPEAHRPSSLLPTRVFDLIGRPMNGWIPPTAEAALWVRGSSAGPTRRFDHLMHMRTT